MTKAQTIWVALVVVAAACLAQAEQPVVWYPAQQAPDTQAAQPAPGQAGQQPSTGASQPPSGQQPGAQPGQQPGVRPGQQPETSAGSDARVDQPLQPIAPLDAAPKDVNAAPQAPAWTPDTTPLNSIQNLTLGEGGGGRNYLIPSFRMSQFGSVTSGVPDQGWASLTNVSGRLELAHHWRRSMLTIDNVGGGMFVYQNSSGGTNSSSGFDELSFMATTQLGRWNFTLSDQAMYLPLSAFGFNGLAGLSPGAGIGNIGSGYVPNQSILGLGVSEITNTAGLQVGYQATPRSSIHFGATYGILRFQSGGLINSDTDNFTAGYDRAFGAFSTLGVSYAASLIRYGGSDHNITTHAVNLTYGRRLTARMALQLGAGPQYREFSDPVTGSGNGLSWDARAQLLYQFGQLGLGASYVHTTTSGAGFMVGSAADILEANISRSLGRQWGGSLTFGIARNSTLAESGFPNRVFNTQFAGFQVQHSLGRQASLFFSYNLQHQSMPLPLCLGCGDTLTRHVFGIGFDWQARPVPTGL